MLVFRHLEWSSRERRVIGNAENQVSKQTLRPLVGEVRRGQSPLRSRRHPAAASRAAVASWSARSFIGSPAWPRTHFHST